MPIVSARMDTARGRGCWGARGGRGAGGVSDAYHLNKQNALPAGPHRIERMTWARKGHRTGFPGFILVLVVPPPRPPHHNSKGLNQQSSAPPQTNALRL